MLKKPLLLLLFICFGVRAFSAVFVVTSNADSGPGTLRDALTQAAANGTAEKDYINFNIADLSEAGRTITVITQLPDLTGNIVVDGTTQPGAVLGVSDAKITITVATPVQNLNAFNIASQIGANDTVELYGLYIEGFTQGYESGINVNNDCKLIVGAPGKGDVISNNWCGLFGSLDNGVIQSSFIGIEPDGETPLPNLTAAVAGNYFFNNLLIGGADPADGNVILGSNQAAVTFGTGTGANTSETVTIENNFFGTDYKGTTAISYYTQSFINAYVPTINLTVTNNVFSASSTAINVYGVGFSSVSIKGNYFGTDRSQTHQLGTGGEAMNIRGFTTATVGGVADADQNVFTNYDNPIQSDNIAQVAIIKNSFYCNRIVALYYIPSNLKITKLLDNEASGDAPAGSTVQLYYTTSSCPTCNPKTWFATVTADGNGVWDYQGDTRQNIMISATSGTTIGFQPLSITNDEVTIVNFDCHHSGSIALNEKRLGRLQLTWTDSNGNVISNDQQIGNLAPGTYTLQITEGGSCPTESGSFTITDLRPRLSPVTYQLNCNSPTADLSGPTVLPSNFTVTNYYWLDSTKNVISTQQSLKGVSAGKYYLYITDSNGCNSDTVLYDVLPPLPVPVIDASKMVISNAGCSFSDGSIIGLTVSSYGVYDYGWSKSDGTTIAYGQLNLTNVPPGQYYFFIYSDYNCPPVISNPFIVGSKNAVTIDDANVVITPAACSANVGSITNLKITGATQYQWLDANNNTVGTSTDLQNVPSGKYTFTASNSFGCSKTLVYTIPQMATTKLPDYAAKITTACNTANTGGVSVAIDGLVKSARWVDSTGTTIGTSPTLIQAFAGTYQLYLTDQNGCESFYKSYTVPSYPEFTIANYGTTSADECNLNNGAVSATTMAGGVPPYSYKWTDLNGNQLSTDNAKNNLIAGDYYLFVNDTGGCGGVRITYTIPVSTDSFPAPSVSDVQLCSSGSGLITVNNAAVSNNYRLYSSLTATNPIDEQKGGRFTVNVTGNSTYYVTEVDGTCESNRTPVKVTVGLSTINIANAFTPNGDGINDYWQITGIDNYPTALVQIFNRYGQKLFESKGYSIPFDGTYKGQKLASGVYYYIINLNTKCNLLSGSLTILR